MGSLARRLACSVLGVSFLVACGGGASENAGAASASAGSAKPAATFHDDVGAPPAPDAPAGTIARARIDDTLTAGPGTFLQHVVLSDEPVMIDGKFHGFRIKELRGEMWKGVDLRPGDVVTRVNGFAIERPEQAVEAFHSLSVASELRVAYDRDGAPHELRYAIVDPLPPATPVNAPNAGKGAAKSDAGSAAATTSIKSAK